MYLIVIRNGVNQLGINDTTPLLTDQNKKIARILAYIKHYIQ